MRLLILSYFYPPDISAGAFRTAALVDALKIKNIHQLEIDVITTAPNRYSKTKIPAEKIEYDGNVTILRIDNYLKNSGKISQIINFIHYAIGVKKIIKNKKYNVIYATSSKLMTACLGVVISKEKKVPVYLDIRDIFVETLRDVHSYGINFFLVAIFTMIEKWTINAASHLNLVSSGFAPYFEPRFPKKKITYHTNGIDENFIKINSELADSIEEENCNLNKRKVILYAGNIGDGQGLEAIIPRLAFCAGQDFCIRVVGDGSKKNILINLVRKNRLENVVFLNPMQRDELIFEYENADILFLHLNSCLAFEKVLPSKIFEYAALGKPILAGVSGYPKKFIEENIENAQVFFPCDVESAIVALKKLNMKTLRREDFVQNFSRKSIMNEMADEISYLR